MEKIIVTKKDWEYLHKFIDKHPLKLEEFNKTKETNMINGDEGGYDKDFPEDDKDK